ncbi:glycosyltransferase [Ramlibacter sp. MMS24-I3-19]|uniref:glycosyltransferase n=1 Tax=Ramlibacter sp. MMS24-I3-19 TaxID=3416606 RepID=UPI003CFDAF18
MRAYITLLSTPDYLPGVACLAASLQRTGTHIPLVVAVSAGLPQATRNALTTMPGVAQVLPLPADGLLPGWAVQQHHHWAYTFDKLWLFGLDQFSKLVYLDCDMVVLQNIDDLFNAPHMAAVDAGRLVNSDWIRLNSGLMVIEPKAELPQRIATTLEMARDEMQRDGRPALGDQDLINSFYADWSREGPHLDQGDNCFFDYVDAYLDTGLYALPGRLTRGTTRGLRVVHFAGRYKPWMPRARLRNALALLRGRMGPGQREVLRTYGELLRRVP